MRATNVQKKKEAGRMKLGRDSLLGCSQHAPASSRLASKGDAMKVKLSAVRNPDFRTGRPSDIDAPMPKDEERNCTSVEEASMICRAWLDGNELGGGNWTGGQITDGNNIVGRISYNGRFWPNES